MIDSFSPGNALFYSEQLELLIEAVYLLHQKPELKGRRFKGLRESLQSFFNYASLAKWKKRHYAFTHAVLSNSSVADELSAVIVFRHIDFLKKLIMQATTINLSGD